MITRDTVLVVGAGGSKEYACPLGRDLVQQVHESATGVGTGGGAREVLEGCGLDAGEVDLFGQYLAKSQPPSVDVFLEGRQDLQNIGRHLMAYVLVQKEAEANLNRLNRDPDEHWYQYVLDRLWDPSFKKLAENRLSVVTLNYDRSFEHFIHTGLLHRSGRPAEQVDELMRQMHIVHVHGQLGYLPWQIGPEEERRPYQTTQTWTEVSKAAKSIRIISDEIEDDDPHLKNARKLIEKAERVCFLGFGYHLANIRRLQLKDTDQSRTWGTVVGLHPEEISRMFRDSGKVFDTKQLKHVGSIVEFFRRYFELR